MPSTFIHTLLLLFAEIKFCTTIMYFEANTVKIMLIAMATFQATIVLIATAILIVIMFLATKILLETIIFLATIIRFFSFVCLNSICHITAAFVKPILLGGVPVSA